MLKDDEEIKLARSVFDQSFYEFFFYFWDTIIEEELLLNFHIKLICDELQEVGERVIKREPKTHDLIINVPPGSSKSLMASVMFPVWLWTRDPSIRIISGSHSGSLAISHASLSRDIMRHEDFQALYADKFQVRKDMDTKGYYKNNKKGSRRTTSVGSKITGEHAHILLVDDPIDPKGARSKAILEQTDIFMNKTLPSRRVEKKLTPTVLIMQRLSTVDPTGTMLKQAEESELFNVRQICLPATNDYDVVPLDQVVNFEGTIRTVEKFYEESGGLLDPIRMDRQVLAEFEVKLGPSDYAGQFGQSPRAAGGNIVKDWMLPIIPWHQVPDGARRQVRDVVADMADKTKEVNDNSGWLAYTAFGGYLFIFAYQYAKLRFSQRVKALRTFVNDFGHPGSRVFIEPKSSGPATYQFMQDHTTLAVQEWVMAEGDKVARLNSVLPFLEARRVVLVEGPWNDYFKTSVTSFNGMGAFPTDEEVDCLVMACINTFLRKVTQGYGATTF